VRYAECNSYRLIASAKLHECSISENEEHFCLLSQIISFYLVQLKFVSSYSSQFSYYPRFLLFIFFQHFPFHFVLAIHPCMEYSFSVSRNCFFKLISCWEWGRTRNCACTLSVHKSPSAGVLNERIYVLTGRLRFRKVY